ESSPLLHRHPGLDPGSILAAPKEWIPDQVRDDESRNPPQKPPLLINARIQPAAPDHADARGDGVAIAARETRRADRLPLFRQRQDGDTRCRLARCQLCRAMLEITLCARLDTISPDPRLGDVEVNLHDPPLAPYLLDQEGEPHLGHLAD